MTLADWKNIFIAGMVFTKLQFKVWGIFAPLQWVYIGQIVQSRRMCSLSFSHLNILNYLGKFMPIAHMQPWKQTDSGRFWDQHKRALSKFLRTFVSTFFFTLLTQYSWHFFRLGPPPLLSLEMFPWFGCLFWRLLCMCVCVTWGRGWWVKGLIGGFGPFLRNEFSPRLCCPSHKHSSHISANYWHHTHTHTHTSLSYYVAFLLFALPDVVEAAVREPRL